MSNKTILTIVVISIASIILLIVLLLILLNILFYKMFKTRFDGDKRYKFQSLKGFPGLKQDDISVNSVYKVKLNGGLFYYPNRKYKGVVIFYHGLLSGYINYLNVIEYLAKNNFKVVAFDMLGCMSSEGESTKGMVVGDKDNKVIIDYVIHNNALNKLPLFTLGHSWGGHIAMTSLLHDDIHIKKAVAICPYNSNVDCVYSMNPKAKIISPLLHLLNLFKFGKEAEYSVSSAIKYTTADVMILTSGEDHIVKPKYSYNIYKKVIESNGLDNVKLKFYKDSNHFLYMCDEGAKHFEKEVSFPRKTPIDFSKLDYKLINKLNYPVMDEIIDFFTKKNPK